MKKYMKTGLARHILTFTSTSTSASTRSQYQIHSHFQTPLQPHHSSLKHKYSTYITPPTKMSNLAAIQPAAKAPLEVQKVENYTPGPNELLIKNEVIAFNPVEYKMAKMAIFPMQYPAIIGTSYGGTISAIGSQITSFKIGDRVAAAKENSTVGNQYSSYQQYVIAKPETTTKLPDNVDIAAAASEMGNLATVVALFSSELGLDRPALDGTAQKKNKKILIYGGSSSFGTLAVQYVSQAGYTVITTSSPQHMSHVSKLGAAAVVNHKQAQDAVIKELVSHGPYDHVIDSISLPNTVPILAAVLASQGGDHKIYCLQPAFGPETLPSGISRAFGSWGNALAEPSGADLKKWTYETYLPQGLASGKIIPLPIERVAGGLAAIDGVLGRMMGGVSGVKLVADPRE